MIVPQKTPDQRIVRSVGEIWLNGKILNPGEPGPGITAAEWIAQLAALGPVEELQIRINSIGGHLEATRRIVAAVMGYPARRITTIAVTKCCSLAVNLWAVGRPRLMTKHAVLMLHDMNINGDSSPAVCVRESEQACDFLARQWPRIPRAKIREWMNNETWFDAGEALKAGIATGIDTTTKEHSKVDLTGYKRPVFQH